MASSSSSSSSHSSSTSPQKNYDIQEHYDVFLSFRGEDTRRIFVCHLYAALCAKQISTFIDDRGLDRGDKISPGLMKAIEASKIWVVIFSENYANSTWCLKELAHILKCKERNEQSTVMPIFYRIDPSTVRKQKGSYKRAFVDLEKRFKRNMGKVRRWRAALKKACGQCGLHSTEFRTEAELIQQIVKDVSLKLPKFEPANEYYKSGLIGIEEKIKEIKSLLCAGSQDVRIIGIWGMGGIGKTTLASVLYQELSHSQFHVRCFLENVREEHAKCGSGLRRKLLSELLNDEALVNTDTPFVPSPHIVDRLCNKKVLLVLDDVDSSEELKELLKYQLAPGSIIFVTSTDVRALDAVPEECRYKVNRLNHDESLELFCLHASRKNSPPMGNKYLLDEATWYADGNPLALKVLASFLSSKSEEDWKIALAKMEKFPDQDQIFNVLKTSYEGLEKNIQNLFLDIACLFRGSFYRDHVESLLDAGDSLVKVQINVLIDKSLIDHEIYSKGILRIHDLLQQMGQKIVHNEHKRPGHRTRLWDAEDVFHVLERDTGTEAVEVISFNMSTMTRDIKVAPAALSKMCNLRILKIDCDNSKGRKMFKLSISQGFDPYLSENLNYFHWDLYPLESLPSNFSPDNLVELRLRGSNVQKLWSHEVKRFPILRKMDLSYSKHFKELPNLSQLAPKLEILNLEGCTSLVEVFPSLQNHPKLTDLNLSGCSKLRDFKKETSGYMDLIRFGGFKKFLGNVRDLKFLLFKSSTNNLSPSCSFSQKFLPMNLTVLRLHGTPIEELPSSICYLSGLVNLDLDGCENLESLPTNICKLKSLASLNLSHCLKLEKFPEILEPMVRLKLLILDGAAIKELPGSIKNLCSLEQLFAIGCKNIQLLPYNLCTLTSLFHMDLKSCSKLQHFDIFPPNMVSLNVSYCLSLKSLSELPLTPLTVIANHCTSLEKISNGPSLLHDQLPDLTDIRFMPRINFCGCQKLDHNAHNILAEEAVLRILSSVNLDHDFDPNPYTQACYTGDEIPEWFNYKTLGNSMSGIMVPPNWNNDEFLGLAVCVVLNHNATASLFKVRINFEFRLETMVDDGICGPSFRFFDDIPFSDGKMNLDHVAVKYCRRLRIQNSRGMRGLNWPSTCSMKATFDVWLSFYDWRNETSADLGNAYGEIKKCGFQLVYKGDLQAYLEEITKSKRKRISFDARGSAVVGSDEEDDTIQCSI